MKITVDYIKVLDVHRFNSGTLFHSERQHGVKTHIQNLNSIGFSIVQVQRDLKNSHCGTFSGSRSVNIIMGPRAIFGCDRKLMG